MSEAEQSALVEAELLARFVYDSDKINNERVLPAAFMPRFEADLNRYETSVCRLVGCSSARIWEIASQRGDKPTKGYAEFKVSAALVQNLRCLAWPEEKYPEHAVVIGWAATKPEQKLAALALSKASSVRRSPN